MNKQESWLGSFINLQTNKKTQTGPKKKRKKKKKETAKLGEGRQIYAQKHEGVSKRIHLTKI